MLVGHDHGMPTAIQHWVSVCVYFEVDIPSNVNLINVIDSVWQIYVVSIVILSVVGSGRRHAQRGEIRLIH